MEDLIAGRPPNFIIRHAPEFAPLTDKLESLSKTQSSLRKQVAERKFNLEAIFASMVEGVMAVDAAGMIRTVNRSFRELWNLPSDPLGHTVLRALRNAEVHELTRDTLGSGEALSRDIAVEGGSAGIRQFVVNAAPFRDAAGALAGAVVVFQDVTRLRQLEEIRRDFVANVSHELRTPLAIFRGYLERLIEGPALPEEELVGTLRILDKHSRRLHALVEDLLTLARLESRGELFEFEDVELGPFLEEIVSEWQPRFDANKLVAAIALPPILPPVRADRFRLEQVIDNLLDNAIKWSPPGGSIRLSAHLEGSSVDLRVEDNGAGIPPADLPHIFTRFYRVEKARSRGGASGTGLGLSIVKHIVAMHGGSVRAESAFGKGTAITVSLPAARARRE